MSIIVLAFLSPFVFPVCAESMLQAVSKASAALRAELDEERRKYQGLLREFTRLEQRYDNLREMSLITEVHHCTYLYKHASMRPQKCHSDCGCFSK